MPGPAAELLPERSMASVFARLPRTRPRPEVRDIDWSLASDDDLTQACAARDGDAFTELVRRYERSLFNAAFRLLRRHDEATDATQQALVQAYVALPTSRFGLPVRPWLFRILRNHCIDRLRRKDAIPFSSLYGTDDHGEIDATLDAPDVGPLPDELAERSDLTRIVHGAIERLAPRYRTVVTLRYHGELSFAEIGRCLGVPEPTARTLFQRAKLMLRTTLAGQV